MPVSYVGRTDSSKYYITNEAIALQDLIEGSTYDFSRMKDHLVSIRDSAENALIRDLFTSPQVSSELNLSAVKRVWLGISDADAENDWRHISDNSPVDFFNWSSRFQIHVIKCFFCTFLLIRITF